MKKVNFNSERNVFGIPVKLPKPPPLKEIDGYNLKKKDQRFIPPKLPEDFNLDNPSMDDLEFIDREWNRRENGYWFFNNGNLEYITGLHYFYISYWKIPVVVNGRKRLGLPSWVDSDRDYFYLWNQCVVDPNCFGLIYVTNRRDGKTHRANCTLYEGASKTEEAEVGIQSKTNSDAKAVFNKLIKSWQSIHPMWKPIDTGESKPSTKLEFNEPAKRNTKNQKKVYGDVLRSEITYQNVKDEAYDGYGLFLYLMDEYGKCLRKGTEVRMFDGSVKKVEDITKGELLMGIDSTSREVKSIAKGKEQMYEIIPNKGDSWGCNESHILSLKCSSDMYVNNIKYKKNDTLNISVRNYLELSDRTKRHLMQYKVGVDYRKVNHQLDPYMLGLWLGDGSSHNPSITAVESEIVSFIKTYAVENDLTIGKYDKYKNGSSVTYRLSNPTRAEGSNIFLKSLQDLNLIKNKHIPSEYLIDSEENRLSLLAGIIDTDGHLSKRNKKPTSYEVTQKNKNIADGVYELANSLGFYASITPKIATMKRDDGSIYECEVFRVFIYGDLWRIPCLVKKKIATKCSFNNNRRNPLRTGFKVVKKEIGDYYGFTISDDNLFLLKDYTVTHNTVDGDVYNRWNIVRECFSDGSTITGTAILTTTVEELERKGGINALKIWNESDYYDKGITGRTKSGLYRAFKPASYGLRGVDEKGIPFIDEYGYSDQERTREYHLKVRSTLSGEALSSYKRKYPLDEEEAFMMDSKDSPFDINRVQDQLSFNNHNDAAPTRGNFAWANGQQDTTVVWHPDPNGRWLVDWHPKPEHRNKWTMVNGYRKPTGTTIVSGVDPFDHKTTTDNKQSDAACYGLKKFDPLNPGGSNCFISEYVNRPSTPEMFYEDILMQNVYFSSEVLIENNKPGILNYFRMRGYYGYLMKRPESTQTKFSKKSEEPGIPMSGDAARDALVNGLVTYIYDNIGYNQETDTYGTCSFNHLLNDWIRFDVSKWTDYDSTVASGLAILASLKPVVETITFDITQFHKKFDQSGGQSRIIR